MVQGIKINYKGSHKGNLACDKCELKCDETQCHTLLCDGWKEQREGVDLTQMQKFCHLLYPTPGREGVKEGLVSLSRGQDVYETPGNRQEAAGGDSAIVKLCKLYGKHLE